MTETTQKKLTAAKKKEYAVALETIEQGQAALDEVLVKVRAFSQALQNAKNKGTDNAELKAFIENNVDGFSELAIEPMSSFAAWYQDKTGTEYTPPKPVDADLYTEDLEAIEAIIDLLDDFIGDVEILTVNTSSVEEAFVDLQAKADEEVAGQGGVASNDVDGFPKTIVITNHLRGVVVFPELSGLAVHPLETKEAKVTQQHQFDLMKSNIDATNQILGSGNSCVKWKIKG